VLESIENEALLAEETASGLRYSVEMSAGQQLSFRHDDGVPADLRVRSNIVREAFERFWGGLSRRDLLVPSMILVGMISYGLPSSLGKITHSECPGSYLDSTNRYRWPAFCRFK
jgi:hypothetical protein